MATSFVLLYVLSCIWTGLLILGIINLFRVAQRKPLKFSHFSYSTVHYYIALLPLSIPLMAMLIYTGDSRALILFVVFGFAGVAGETLFSLYWDALFVKKFWVYTNGTIFNTYSSVLNFIPWGIGGLLYVSLARHASYEPSLNELLLFWLVALGGAVILMLSRVIVYIVCHYYEYPKVTAVTYVLAMLPFVVALGMTAYVHGHPAFVAAAVLFGVVAFVAEYLFGKYCEYFVSQKLWTYTYCAFDGGHITPLSIIPFMVGGFWFTMVYVVVTTVL